MENDNTYKFITTLNHGGGVISILHLKRKKVLESCGYSPSVGVTFWNLKNYNKQQAIKGYSIIRSSHMVELSSENIGIYSRNQPFPIIIINS